MRRGLAMMLLMALAACGSERSGTASAMLSSVRGVFDARSGEEVDVRSALSRAALAQATEPILLIEIPRKSAVALTGVFGQNGDVITWRTQDEVNFSFREGVLVSTRGLERDLISADVAEPVAALFRGGARAGGTAVRVHRYLDGELQLRARSYVCRYENRGREVIEIVEALHETRAVREVCTTTDGAIENHYWIGADGTVWKSRQWLGEEMGYLITERLVR